MAALVVPGAPVSVLLDHGLDESMVEKLMTAGIPTVERLGSMTPEELETIEGVGAELVETIQLAVNSYYGQFEGSVAEENKEETKEAAAEEVKSEPENESVTIESTEHPEPSSAS